MVLLVSQINAIVPCMFLDVRTKATVEEGIVTREGLEGRLVVSYTPGNGTKYDLMFTELSGFSELTKDLMGVPEKCWLVTVLNHDPRPSIILSDSGQFLHWTYVQEKLGLREPDAVVVTELIGHITGRPYATSEEVLHALKAASSEDSDPPESDKIAEEAKPGA